MPLVYWATAAEGAATEAGGCVVRLAGLYSVDRGPHNHWLLQKEVWVAPVIEFYSFAHFVTTFYRQEIFECYY